MKLTPHFTIEELSVTSNRKYKTINLESAKEQMGKMYMLAGFAERVREIVGKPMIISSAYRCPELNAAVGGAISSQHKYAEAIDFVCKGIEPELLACKIAASDLKFNQLIVEYSGNKSWVHVSIGSKREVLRYKNGKYTSIGELA